MFATYKNNNYFNKRIEKLVGQLNYELVLSKTAGFWALSKTEEQKNNMTTSLRLMTKTASHEPNQIITLYTSEVPTYNLSLSLPARKNLFRKMRKRVA